MKICFQLSMPNVGSWNGKWTGASKLYAKIIDVGTAKKTTEKYKSIVEAGSFYYNFGDGWGASVSVKVVTGREAASIKKKSSGFCGYDWMIYSIMEHGCIQTD